MGEHTREHGRAQTREQTREYTRVNDGRNRGEGAQAAERSSARGSGAAPTIRLARTSEHVGHEATRPRPGLPRAAFPRAGVAVALPAEERRAARARLVALALAGSATIGAALALAARVAQGQEGAGRVSGQPPVASGSAGVGRAGLDAGRTGAAGGGAAGTAETELGATARRGRHLVPTSGTSGDGASEARSADARSSEERSSAAPLRRRRVEVVPGFRTRSGGAAGTASGSRDAAESLWREAEQATTAAYAEVCYREIVIAHADAPRAPEALFRLGALRLARGDRGGALEAFGRYVRSYPGGVSAAQAVSLVTRLRAEEGREMLALGARPPADAPVSAPATRVGSTGVASPTTRAPAVVEGAPASAAPEATPLPAWRDPNALRPAAAVTLDVSRPVTPAGMAGGAAPGPAGAPSGVPGGVPASAPAAVAAQRTNGAPAGTSNGLTSGSRPPVGGGGMGVTTGITAVDPRTGQPLRSGSAATGASATAPSGLVPAGTLPATLVPAAMVPGGALPSGAVPGVGGTVALPTSANGGMVPAMPAGGPGVAGGIGAGTGASGGAGGGAGANGTIEKRALAPQWQAPRPGSAAAQRRGTVVGSDSTARARTDSTAAPVDASGTPGGGQPLGSPPGGTSPPSDASDDPGHGPQSGPESRPSSVTPRAARTESEGDNDAPSGSAGSARSAHASAPMAAGAAASVGAAAGVSYSVQLAAYPTRAAAESLAQTLVARGHDARVDGAARPFTVRVGRFSERSAAVAASKVWRARGNPVMIAEILERP